MSELPDYLPDGLRRAAERLLEIGEREHTDDTDKVNFRNVEIEYV